MNKGETKTKSACPSGDTGMRADPQNAAKKLVWWKEPSKGYHLGQVVAEDQEQAEIVVGEKRFTAEWKSLQKANPSKFDLVDNMAHLSYLNEPSILHNLKQRYFAEMQYTYSGLFLVAVNPYKNLPIYTKEFVQKYSLVYKREDEPPHIYAVAGEAYHLMRNTSTPQTILITGESGAGKTENTKHAIAFLTKVSGELSQGACILEERLLYTNPLLEAFGNAQTEKNDNSSRFGKFIRIEFGANGEIVGAFVERYLLESSRVTSQASGEQNYHVFYALTRHADQSTLDALKLHRNKAYKILGAAQGGIDTPLSEVYKSMDILGFTQENQEKIFKILAAIIHLGEVEFVQESACVDIHAECAEDFAAAASLLGVDALRLKETLLRPKIRAGSEVVVHGRTPQEASFTVSSLCKVLYERLFSWIVHLVNASLRTTQHAQSYIGVLDIAGFEILGNNGFEQLCINYTNEKLQQFFNHRMFVLEQETYLQEGLEWDVIDFGLDLQPTIDLLETPGTGIFSILDEECVLPGGSGERLLRKISSVWDSHSKFSIPKVRSGFAITHYAGEVKYREDGWIAKNKDPLDEDIASLMLGARGPIPSESARSGLTATRFRTVAQGHKEQLAGLLKMLHSTNPHFVRCILPNRAKKSGIFDDAQVLHQLQCNGVLEGVRISRQGFPTRIEFREFTQRYALLSRAGKEHIPPAEKGAIALLTELGIPSSLFKIGRTRLFLRQGVLADLEDHRNGKISGVITELQKRLRVLLSENLETLRTQRAQAVSLLQKNIKIYASVRNWSWWKLCMKVRPLLEVRKSEDEIRERDIKIARQSAQIQDLLDRISTLETDYSLAEQQAQSAIAQHKREEIQAAHARAEAEKEIQEIRAELTTAQSALTKSVIHTREMQQNVADLEKKVEHARKDAASVATKKLLAELAELKALHTETLQKNAEMQKQILEAANKQGLVEQERDILAHERDAALEKNRKMHTEMEDLQNEIKVTESLRYKGEVALRNSEGELERLESLLSFEREKLHRLNEAFKKSSAPAPAPAPIVVPPRENKEEISRLQKDLDHERERATIRQREYEELKKEYIDLVDEKLGAMISDKQKLDAEMKKLQHTVAHGHLKQQQAEEAIAELKAEVQKAEDNMESERSKNKALAREIVLRKEKEIDLAQELASARQEVSSLLDGQERAKHTAEIENERRDKMHASVVAEVKALVRYVDDLLINVQSVSSQVTLSMQVVAMYKAEMAKLSAEIVESARVKGKMQQQITRAQAREKDAEHALQLAVSQVQALSQEKESVLAELETELHDQRERHETAEIDWQTERKSLLAEKRKLEREIKEKERANTGLLLAQQERDLLQKKLVLAREEVQKATEEKESACAELMKKIQAVAALLSKEKAEASKYKREAQAVRESAARAESALKEARAKETADAGVLSRLEETVAGLLGREKECALEMQRLELEISSMKLIGKTNELQAQSTEEIQ
ncbi:myosin heavy chain 9/10/11/14 [Nematocida ausubeli]|nr:myosin heavy chain 9/10/11/14 [Nematocida ausubeli]